MKVYPYQSIPVEDPERRTTYIVRSNERLAPEEIQAAIEDLTLERAGWSEPHPQRGGRWTYIEIRAPVVQVRREAREAAAATDGTMSGCGLAPAMG